MTSDSTRSQITGSQAAVLDTADSQVQVARNKVEYCEDWDYEHVYACIGSFGSGGMFRLVADKATGIRAWQFVVPDSPSHSGAWERIFAAHRSMSITEPDVIATFPPLPPVPPGPYPSAESYRLPKEPLKVADFPNTLAWLEQSEEAVLWVVLYEDLWETRHGDGKYKYFHDVFETQAQASPFSQKNPEAYTVVPLRVSLDKEQQVFEFPGFFLGYCEHYRPEEVLKRFEEKQATHSQEAALSL